MKKISVFLLFIFMMSVSVGAQNLEPIDSVFLGSFRHFSEKVEKFRDSIWPGMAVGPYCIFRSDGPAFLANHPDPPPGGRIADDNIRILNQKDFGLFGATQSLINGVLTAHNDYGQKFYSSANQFYAELFHELQHLFQRNYIKDLKYDNPADLLTYPENDSNFAIRQYENSLLLDMLSEAPDKFRHSLDLFFTCRNRRKEMIGVKYMDYEKGAESVEGPAMFCEYQYLKKNASDMSDEEYIHHRYFYSLTEPFYSRNDLRGNCLLTGLAQCMILSKYVSDWQSEYYSSGLFLYDYFVKKMSPREAPLPDLTYNKAKAKYFTGIEKQKHSINYQDFTRQPGVKVVLLFEAFPDFRGFDPMHAESVNDSTILHSTLLRLGNAGNMINILNYKAVTGIADQVWFVKKVEFFVPEESIRTESNRLFISYDGKIEIKWTYISRTRKDNIYRFILQ